MTCRFLPVLGLLGLAVWLAATPADVRGCGSAFQQGQRMDVADETALIIWDNAARTEHLVRRATFVGSARDFGFLVPTPNPPELEEASADLFDELAKITEPKTEYRTLTEFSFGCGGSSGANPGEEPKDAALPPGVVVLEQKRVGPYAAEVLKFRADNSQKPEDVADGLLSWLKRNKYLFRDDLRAWLVPYIRDNWIITAFKIAGDQPGDQSAHAFALKAAAVRMSFKADQPFFPYREPADQRDETARNTSRLLRVYVAAKHRMAGRIGETTPWPGQPVWASAISDAERRSLLEKAGNLPPKTGSETWWLTEFEDRSAPRPGTDELYFQESADGSPMLRQPRIVTAYKSPWWVGPVLIGVPLVLIVGGILVWRQSRMPPPKKGPLPFP
jgi:hypothetical protein